MNNNNYTNRFLIVALLMMVGLFGFTNHSNAQEAYTVFDENDHTLTFKYDNNKPEGAYEMNEGRNRPSWSACCSRVGKVIFDKSFKDYRPTSCYRWFSNCYYLTAIDGMKENLNTENVTDMSYMFASCQYLTSLDVSNFNTEKVTDMSNMFAGCQYLTSLDISNFNTKNVTDMSCIFYGCHSLTTIDISNFNTTNVTDMRYMFYSCSGLETIYVGDDWNTDNVKSSSGMFGYCQKLYGVKGTLYNDDYDDVDYAHIDEGESNQGYFTKKGEEKCTVVSIEIKTMPLKLDYVVNEPLQIEDATITVKFSNGVEQTQKLKYAEVSGYKSIAGKQTLTVEYLGKTTSFDVNVIDKISPYHSFDADNNTLTYFYDQYRDGAYYGWNKDSCPSNIYKVILESSCINNKIENVFGLFTSGQVMKEIDGLQYLNTENVTDMSCMFSECNNLEYLDLSSLNTKNVTSMMAMFSHCNKLKSIILTGFNTENVVDMSGMFYMCASLESLDLSSFDTRNVSNMSNMFCLGAPGFGYTESDITAIFVGQKWNTDKVSDCMFAYCDNLVGGEGTKFDANYSNDVSYARIDGGESAPGYFTAIAPVSIAIKDMPKDEYIEGEPFTAENGTLTLTYNSGRTETIDFANASITGFDNTNIGEQTITVSYLNLETTYTITMSAKPIENPYTQPPVKDDCYQIATLDELLWFMFDVNHGNVTANAALVNDIVINEECLKRISEMLNKTTKAEPQITPWNPIGTSEYPFKGTFDGRGHTITGVYINDENQNNIGLFGVLSESAFIKNLGVTDSYIAGNENVGAICGSSEGTIVNCYSVSEVKGNKNVNELVGDKTTKAVIENCYYLAEESDTNDPCAKTAEEFKSGDVAKLLSQGATINGITYSGESFAGITVLPGTDIIEVKEDPDNPSTAVSEISASNIRIWSFGSTVYVENATSDIYIVNLSGSLITKRTPESSRMEICLNNKGVFIVKTGDTTQKIIIQ